MEVKDGRFNDVTFGFTKIPIKNGYFVVHNDSFQRIAFIWAKIGQKVSSQINWRRVGLNCVRLSIIVWDKIVFLLNIYKKEINGK